MSYLRNLSSLSCFVVNVMPSVLNELRVAEKLFFFARCFSAGESVTLRFLVLAVGDFIK